MGNLRFLRKFKVILSFSSLVPHVQNVHFIDVIDSCENVENSIVFRRTVALQ